MLVSKIIGRKKQFTTAIGDIIDDLISSTFTYPERSLTFGPSVVKEEESMRPDKLANRLYSDGSYWDMILKFNGISNPFSLVEGEILFVPALDTLRKAIKEPSLVPEKGMNGDLNTNEKKLVNPKTNKDKKMLEALRKKVGEVVPPNVNKTGVKNITTRDGLVILGGSMTQAKEANSSGSLSRSRVINNLNNSNGL
jgi:hypothetical protein